MSAKNNRTVSESVIRALLIRDNITRCFKKNMKLEQIIALIIDVEKARILVQASENQSRS